jgi:hypothetical protein
MKNSKGLVLSVFTGGLHLIFHGYAEGARATAAVVRLMFHRS